MDPTNGTRDVPSDPTSAAIATPDAAPAASPRSDGDSLEVVRTEDTLRICLVGDVDIVRRDELDGLVSAFRESGATRIEIDLAGVEFLDSTGLSALVRLDSLARERGGHVRVLSPQRAVLRALEISGVVGLVDVV